MLTTEHYPAADGRGGRLLVVLHGLGDSAAGYRWMPGVLGVPDLGYLLVNAPDDYYGGYSWYDIGPGAGEGVARSRALLFELLQSLRAEGRASQDIYLFGFSQGCLMVTDVGLRWPEPLGGVIGVSGYVHEPDALLRERAGVSDRQRLLVTHGTMDDVIPLAMAERQFRQLSDAGLRVDWRVFEKAHTIDGERELDVIRRFIAAGATPEGS